MTQVHFSEFVSRRTTPSVATHWGAKMYHARNDSAVASDQCWASVEASRPVAFSAIDYSFAGMLGRALEPIFAPIGFNWQMVIALIPGMAAREVAVAALGTTYVAFSGG